MQPELTIAFADKGWSVMPPMDASLDPAWDFSDLQLLAAVMGLLLEGRITLLILS